MVTNATPILQCINLTLGYEKKIANPFSLSIYAGEFIALIGNNGVGKSTFLKTIAGFIPPVDGKLLLNNQAIQQIPPLQLAQQLSIVGTEKIQGFNLTCQDAVNTGRSPYTNWLNQLQPNDVAIVEAAIAACQLEPYKHQLLENLSDGLYQKTMIAKALAQQTPFLVLDEPSAFLDYPSKHNLFEVLKNLCQNGKTVVVSSHDLDIIRLYCSHIVLMDAHEGLTKYDLQTANYTTIYQKLVKPPI